jgi:hypothetical protein
LEIRVGFTNLLKNFLYFSQKFLMFFLKAS